MTSPKNSSFVPFFHNKFKHKTETVEDIRARRRSDSIGICLILKTHG